MATKLNRNQLLECKQALNIHLETLIKELQDKPHLTTYFLARHADTKTCLKWIKEHLSNTPDNKTI